MKQKHDGQVPGSSGQNDHTDKTSKKLAQEHGVSEKTVRRAGAAAEIIGANVTQEINKRYSGH